MPPPHANKWHWSFGLDRLSGLYILVLFIIIFGLWQPALFLTNSTAISIATEQSINVMVALAVVLPLAAGCYDLSVGANVNLSTIIVTLLQTSHEHMSMWQAMPIAILAGLTIGLINAFLVVRLHLNSFIATLGVATAVNAVQEIISGQNQPLPPISNEWNNLTQAKLLGVQVIVYYMIIVVLLLWWLLDRMPVGRHIYAVGGNIDAARLSGVRADRLIWLTFGLSGLLSGIVGVLYASLNGPSLTFGSSLLLPAFAAAFLGSTQVRPGRFNVIGTLIAVYVLATGIKGMQLVTGAQWLNDMFYGVSLIAAVTFSTWRQRRARRVTPLVTRSVSGGKPVSREPTGGPPGPAAERATVSSPSEPPA